VRRGKAVYGTQFRNPDFSLIARAYDLDFFRVSDEAGCLEAVEAAVSLARPVLIEALIDPISYPTTPRTPPD